MLPLRARVDLRAKVMKEYSTLPKAPTLLEPHHQNFYFLENKYIDTFVLKEGILGMPCCLEHTGVHFQLLKKVKENENDLTVLWLDFANTQGSIPYKIVGWGPKELPCSTISKWSHNIIIQNSWWEYCQRRYLSLPHTRQDLTQGQWPEGRLSWGFRGGEGRARAEA